MKNLAMLAGLILLSSSAFGYQERIERDGDRVTASFVSPEGVDAMDAGAAGLTPVAGNFHAFTGTFASKDLTCDQFLAKIHALISDWKSYPHANFYALSSCSGQAGQGSTTNLIYALDAWVPEAVPSVQAFLKDHRGMPFEGQALWFSQVKLLDVKTVLTLGLVRSNGSLNPIHAANVWSRFSGTDTWYPSNYAKSKVVMQTDLDVFLDWVGQTFGGDEKTPFKESLVNSNLVQFSDFFTLHLENGKKADFWLGFGANRRCGTQPCFSKPPKPLDEASR